MLQYNLLLDMDSYKASHWLQYPPNTTNIFSYIESRGGVYPETVFFGLQICLNRYLKQRITRKMVNEAALFWEQHGEPFNKAGWMHIVNKHKGRLPVRIRAVREGTVVKTGNVLVTIEATDPACFWLPSVLETMLLRTVWYGTTVSTVSWQIKQTIRAALEKTGDPSLISFKLHDFGARGVSSYESAGIGGAAHLVNFMGSDTAVGILFAREYYHTTDMVGFSIPAAEHSTITAWGREFESEAYRNMLRSFGKKDAMFAVVSDSYDIFNAVDNIWGDELRQEVIDSGSCLVIRPDSGDPATVVVKVLQLLDGRFGSVINSKGYKVLNNVRVIQGDGIDATSIVGIINAVVDAGYSLDNVAFGMGGGLLQHCNRDTQKFAMKCSAALVNGEWIDVFKDPITDSGKRSKKGRISLYKDPTTGELYTSRMSQPGVSAHGMKDELFTVFENGELVTQWSFAEVREASEKF